MAKITLEIELDNDGLIVSVLKDGTELIANDSTYMMRDTKCWNILDPQPSNDFSFITLEQGSC